MSTPEERLAHNQTLFREVNERIEELGSTSGSTEFVCECSDPACTTTVEVALDEYERVRSNPTWFVLKPDHEVPEIERVVSRNEQFLVVEKLVAEEDMKETDPRS